MTYKLTEEEKTRTNKMISKFVIDKNTNKSVYICIKNLDTEESCPFCFVNKSVLTGWFAYCNLHKKALNKLQDPSSLNETYPIACQSCIDTLIDKNIIEEKLEDENGG